MRWFWQKEPIEEPTPFEVDTIPMNGDYLCAQIEEAKVYNSPNTGKQVVKVKVKLIPSNPADKQIGWLWLGNVPYCRLLAGLAIPRTNDPTVLIGRLINVRVTRDNLHQTPSTSILGPLLP